MTVIMIQSIDTNGDDECRDKYCNNGSDDTDCDDGNGDDNDDDNDDDDDNDNDRMLLSMVS